jgi:hypothetical protein
MVSLLVDRVRAPGDAALALGQRVSVVLARLVRRASLVTSIV